MKSRLEPAALTVTVSGDLFFLLCVKTGKSSWRLRESADSSGPPANFSFDFKIPVITFRAWHSLTAALINELLITLTADSFIGTAPFNSEQNLNLYIKQNEQI